MAICAHTVLQADMRITREIWSTNGLSRVTRLPFGLHAKHGRLARISEAFASQFVDLHTEIPVPTILDMLYDKSDMPFIRMNRIPGTPVKPMPINANNLSSAQLS